MNIKEAIKNTGCKVRYLVDNGKHFMKVICPLTKANEVRAILKNILNGTDDLLIEDPIGQLNLYVFTLPIG